MIDQGINTVVRRNDEGRIYGITFIDHESRTVWNGSQLSKNLSATVFTDWWKEQATWQREDTDHASINNPLPTKGKGIAEEQEEAHELFDFLNKEQPAYAINDFGLIDGLGGLLPEAQGEDYEEQAFANRMKKKRHREKGGQK